MPSSYLILAWVVGTNLVLFAVRDLRVSETCINLKAYHGPIISDNLPSVNKNLQWIFQASNVNDVAGRTNSKNLFWKPSTNTEGSIGKDFLPVRRYVH